jgi:phage protein D
MSEIQAIPIYSGQDFYIPHFRVVVGDRPLNKEVIHDIIEVTYKDHLEEVDSLEITINNWDAENRTFKYVDQDLFDPGKQIELWMGYFGPDSLRRMITGQITALRPNFPSSGQPTLVISGLNVLHSLRKKQESFAYTKMTDNEIAAKIAKRLNVDLDTRDTQQKKYPYLLQCNQYDIVFLMERARRAGYDLVVEEPKDKGKDSQKKKPQLYFGPSGKLDKTTYELIYGKSLVDFQPNLTTAKQVGQVTVRGWDPIHKKLIEKTVTRDQIETKKVGSAGGKSRIDLAFNEREEIIADRPIYSEEEAETLARETLDRITKDMITATGRIVGLPDLRAGSVICVDGLGERFSGRYFVTSTTHTIGDSGFTTQFECRREEIPGEQCKKKNAK